MNRVFLVLIFLTSFVNADDVLDKSQKKISEYKTKNEKIQAELEAVQRQWLGEITTLLNHAEKKSLSGAELQSVLEETVAYLPHSTDNGVGEKLETIKLKYGKMFYLSLERMDSMSSVLIKEAIELSKKADD